MERTGYYPQEVEVEVHNQPMTEALVQDFALDPIRKEEPAVNERVFIYIYVSKFLIFWEIICTIHNT